VLKALFIEAGVQFLAFFFILPMKIDVYYLCLFPSSFFPFPPRVEKKVYIIVFVSVKRFYFLSLYAVVKFRVTFNCHKG
jgi:hypothetical protein